MHNLDDFTLTDMLSEEKANVEDLATVDLSAGQMD